MPPDSSFSRRREVDAPLAGATRCPFVRRNERRPGTAEWAPACGPGGPSPGFFGRGRRASDDALRPCASRTMAPGDETGCRRPSGRRRPARAGRDGPVRRPSAGFAGRSSGRCLRDDERRRAFGRAMACGAGGGVGRARVPRGRDGRGTRVAVGRPRCAAVPVRRPSPARRWRGHTASPNRRGDHRRVWGGARFGRRAVPGRGGGCRVGVAASSTLASAPARAAPHPRRRASILARSGRATWRARAFAADAPLRPLRRAAEPG